MVVLLFVLLSIFGLFAIPYGIYMLAVKKESDWWFTLVLLGVIAFAIGVVLTGAFTERQHPIPVKSSEFTVNTEIKVEIVNGQEISRDTVYIFTPKK